MKISMIRSVSRCAESDLYIGNCEDWKAQAGGLFYVIYPKGKFVLEEMANMNVETHTKFLQGGWSLAYELGSTKEKGKGYLFDLETQVTVKWSVFTRETETRWVVTVNNPTFAMVQSIDRGMARRMTFCVDGKDFSGEDLLNTFLMGNLCSEVVFKPIKTSQSAGCVSDDCLRKAVYRAMNGSREAFCCDRADCMQTAAKMLV